MFKRILQLAFSFLAISVLVLAPFACQQAEKPAEETGAAQPEGAKGRRLMAAQPKAIGEKAGEAVEEVAGEVAEGAEEIAGEVAEGAEEGAEEIEEAAGEAAEAIAPEGTAH